ncbi:MinD/ParA family ATP-binding protein [Rhodococcus baikonurensis]|uniref:MinD-like ATPase involved in chromosome partitioning or flagellar assembly n=1 Tax=Rhodococcus baikonurensis TaxID=172041 RepID=A0ABV5XS82_9NOCA
MATFESNDDIAELEAMRAALVAGTPHTPAPPPPVAPQQTRAPEIAQQPVEVGLPDVDDFAEEQPTSPRAEPDMPPAEPRPSFTNMRPRSSGQPSHAPPAQQFSPPPEPPAASTEIPVDTDAWTPISSIPPIAAPPIAHPPVAHPPVADPPVEQSFGEQSYVEQSFGEQSYVEPPRVRQSYVAQSYAEQSPPVQRRAAHSPVTQPPISPPPVAQPPISQAPVAQPPISQAPVAVAQAPVAQPPVTQPSITAEQLQALLAENPGLLAQIGATTTARADATRATPAAAAPANAVAEPEVDTALASADLAKEGWRAWLVKLGLPVRKGATERFNDLMDYAHEVIRRDLGKPIVIGVTSYRGSCGKTSATVVFSRLLAEIRDESVIALDTDLHGTLLSRAFGVNESGGDRQIMMTLSSVLRGGGAEISGKVWDGGDGFVFVPGSRTNKANTVTPNDYYAILDAARQAYRFVFVDMSALMDSELFNTVLHSLDGLVMMAPTVEDGVQTLYETQSDLHQRGVGNLNNHRITVLNNTNPARTVVDTAEFARGLKHRDKRDVVEIRYDKHLSQSTVIDIAHLSQPTTTDFTLALATLIDTFDDRETRE